MQKLMIHIEQAVRPLPIYPQQKLKIREELFAQSCKYYDEEFARLNDEDAAIEAALIRVGPVDQLTQQLQSNLPWYSAILSKVLGRVSRNKTRRDSLFESTLWGWRLGVLFMVVCGIPWFAFMTFRGTFQPVEAAGMWLMMIAYGFPLLWTWVGMVGYTKNGLHRVLFGVALWVTLMSLPSLYYFADWFGPKIAEAWYGRTQKLQFFAIAMLFVPVTTFFVAKTKGFQEILAADRRSGDRNREWECLPI